MHAPDHAIQMYRKGHGPPRMHFTEQNETTPARGMWKIGDVFTADPEPFRTR